MHAGNTATASGLEIVTTPPAPSKPVQHNDLAEPTDIISQDTASASAGTHTSTGVEPIPSSATHEVASQSSSAVNSAAVTVPAATASIPPQPLNTDVPAVLNTPERRSSRAVQPQQDNKLHIALSDLQFHELIGSSPNKARYRGSWNHTSVGILVFRFSGVVANAQTLQRLSSHPNLVQFYRCACLCACVFSDHLSACISCRDFTLHLARLHACTLAFGLAVCNLTSHRLPSTLTCDALSCI